MIGAQLYQLMGIVYFIIEGLFTPNSLDNFNIEEEPMMVDSGVSGTGKYLPDYGALHDRFTNVICLLDCICYFTCFNVFNLVFYLIFLERCLLSGHVKNINMDVYYIPLLGTCDLLTPGEPQIIDPKEQWRERDGAQRASISAEQRALINQRRRQSYHAKKLQMAEETIEPEKTRNRLSSREGKRNYKRR